MGIKKVLSETAHALVAHWITAAVLLLGPTVVALWGRMSADWSWPATVAVGIALVAVCICAFAMVQISRARQPGAEWQKPPREVFRQNYQNETVVLDGKKFIECSFVNTKFVYNGTAKTEMLNCKIAQPPEGTPYFFETESMAILNMMLLLGTLQLFKRSMSYELHKAGSR